MNGIETKKMIRQDIWDDFVANHPHGTVLQSWNWGEFQKSYGRDIWRIGTFLSGKLVGTVLAYRIDERFRPHIYTSNGPVIDDRYMAQVLPELINHLKSIAQNEKLQFIRTDPLIENPKPLKILNFTEAPHRIQAENHWLVDLRPDLDEIMANMRKNTRNMIRRSAREGVKVESSNDFSDFGKFWELFDKTVHRQRFRPHPKKYYEEQVKAFGGSGGAAESSGGYSGEKTKDSGDYRIYWAHRENTILAAALVPFYGNKAYYLHAASDNSIKHTYPAHALIWQVIQDAKDTGLEFFDLWGVAPNDDPDHKMAGFSFFKKSFGGFQKDYIRAQDLPLSFIYHPIRFLLRLKRAI